MVKKIITFVFLINISFCVVSQDFDKAQLDKFFETLEKKNKFMGTVAISRDGKIIYTNVIGFSDVEAKVKSNENTKFRVGSISKTFTTALIFKAIEENKLTISTKLAQYYPIIKNADSITIGQMLSHRSGIHNFTNDTTYLKYNTGKKSEDEMIQIIEKSGSDFKPDSKAEYSNSNFVLLSYILQKVYKKSFDKIVNEKIIEPLGLKNTYVGGKVNLVKNEAYSYTFQQSWTKEVETDLSIPMGAGNIISTPSDLLKFAEALFSGKIISSDNVEQMKTIRDGYGMGLFQVPFYDMKGYSHTGGIDGFRSVFGYFPDKKIGFAVTSNGINYVMNDVSIAMLCAAFNKPYKIPEFYSVDLKSEDLDKYLGEYSSNEMPLKITITKKDKTLMAQATGQPAFALEPIGKDVFEFAPAKVKLEFDPTEKKMILKQNGYTFNYVKQ